MGGRDSSAGVAAADLPLACGVCCVTVDVDDVTDDVESLFCAPGVDAEAWPLPWPWCETVACMSFCNCVADAAKRKSRCVSSAMTLASATPNGRDNGDTKPSLD